MTCIQHLHRLRGVCAVVTAAAVAAAAVASCSTSGGSVGSAAPSPSAPSASVAPPTSTAGTPSSEPTLRDDPVDPAFRAKVEAMCVALLADKITHQPPDGFSVTHPDPASITAVASAIDAQALTHTLVSTASALGAPSVASASWAVVMSDYGAYERAAQSSVASAKASDAAAFGSALTAFEDTKSHLRTDMHAVGFGNRSSCDLLFASGGGH